MKPTPTQHVYSDLHRHLDGSMRWNTLCDLAKQTGQTLPESVQFTPGMGLDEALARFQLTVSCLQTLDSVHRVADEMCVDAEGEGIQFLEIRFAPQLHGGPIQEVVEAALTGIADRAGLILCGLYGEPPAVLDELVHVASQYPGVVGIDLAGAPLATHSWSMRSYAPIFQRAGSLGLGRTVHAGEGRGPEEIATAILELGADRIGHGCSVLQSEEVVALVKARGVVLEACPTSNVHTGIYSSVSEHPIAVWLDQGIPVTLCTDNTLLSNVTLPTEYERIDTIAGMTEEKVHQIVVTGRAAVFT